MILTFYLTYYIVPKYKNNCYAFVCVKKMEITANPIRTRYIDRNEDFIEESIASLKKEIENGFEIKNGDFLVVSEKFIATSEDNFVSYNFV